MTATEETNEVPHVVLQLAMLMQAKDSRAWGITEDHGVTYHPTWDEQGLIGQQEYLHDAAFLVDAMKLLRWGPLDERDRARDTAARLEDAVVTADAERLAAIRARYEVATPREFWETELDDATDDDNPYPARSCLILSVNGTNWFVGESEQEANDIEFAAHAPEDIAYLLTVVAERDALRARIAAIEATARDTIAQWERTDDDDLTDAQYGERGYALGVLATLGVEQPLTEREDPRRRIVSEAERMSIEAMKFRDGVPSTFDWPKP